jgi:hypothetical protein
VLQCWLLLFWSFWCCNAGWKLLVTRWAVRCSSCTAPRATSICHGHPQLYVSVATHGHTPSLSNMYPLGATVWVWISSRCTDVFFLLLWINIYLSFLFSATVSHIFCIDLSLWWIGTILRSFQHGWVLSLWFELNMWVLWNKSTYLSLPCWRAVKELVFEYCEVRWLFVAWELKFMVAYVCCILFWWTHVVWIN